jgi:hypothetical protein
VQCEQGQGIGIEVWLPDPADWNRRVHALGNGAWACGTDIASSDVIGALYAAAIAATEASVTAQTDTGHSDPPMPAAGQLFTALTDWVEKGVAPTNVVGRGLQVVGIRSAVRARVDDENLTPSTRAHQGITADPLPARKRPLALPITDPPPWVAATPSSIRSPWTRGTKSRGGG